jgi:hypothetical protein
VALQAPLPVRPCRLAIISIGLPGLPISPNFCMVKTVVIRSYLVLYVVPSNLQHSIVYAAASHFNLLRCP